MATVGLNYYYYYYISPLYLELLNDDVSTACTYPIISNIIGYVHKKVDCIQIIIRIYFNIQYIHKFSFFINYYFWLKIKLKLQCLWNFLNNESVDIFRIIFTYGLYLKYFIGYRNCFKYFLSLITN